MDQFDHDPESRQQELIERVAQLKQQRAQLDQELAQAREAYANLQEEALMAVPQHLLSQVNGGSAEDFKAIFSQMTTSGLTALDAFTERLDRLS